MGSGAWLCSADDRPVCHVGSQLNSTATAAAAADGDFHRERRCNDSGKTKRRGSGVAEISCKEVVKRGVDGVDEMRGMRRYYLLSGKSSLVASDFSILRTPAFSDFVCFHNDLLCVEFLDKGLNILYFS